MATTYRIRWVPFAQQQYMSLPREGKAAVNRALREIRQNPERGSFDRRYHDWVYATPEVLVRYSVEHNLVTITVLRVLYGK